MWIMLNDAFFSIVHKDCGRDELLVRARRKGDIEKVFPGVKVLKTTNTDYLFRARITKKAVAEALTLELSRVTYGNFKSSVADKALHDAYLRVWTSMASVQPTAPYGGRHLALDFEDAPQPSLPGIQARKTKRSLKRGR